MKDSTYLHLGTAYYPEHWPETSWNQDAILMKEAGINVARMAEFAWSNLEPDLDHFCFDWLDHAIDLLASHGIMTVLGTPTAAPPAWLIQLHPDILPIDENGSTVQFGNRCHYCVNSLVYHQAVRKIVGAMAQHYGNNSNVVGWQIDNEYNRVCYCENCRRLFQQYLVEKYETLEEMNSRWATAYWSQTYSDWKQIPTPVGPHNPGLMMEFKQFVTQSYRKFQKLQLEELTPYLIPGVWTTHNFMGWYDGFNHYELCHDLDLASWDWYVTNGHNDFPASGLAHDLTRGFKNKNFWVIETQAGNVNWSSINNMLTKGEGRTMAWQAIAHGADAVSYWQWRSAFNGQEQLHGTLVDASGQSRPFYEEVCWIGTEFQSLSSLIAGSEPRSKVAMLNSYPSRWALGWQPHHKDFDYVKHFNHYYRPLAERGINVDVLDADGIVKADHLSGYKLVIAPALNVVSEQLASTLTEFVLNGGHLVITIRCGQKDRCNALLPSRQPGLLRNIAGIEVEEFYSLFDPVPVIGDGLTGTSTIWAERLLACGEIEEIARFGKSNGWLDDQLAIAGHRFGKGLVYTIGAYLDPASQQKMIEKILYEVSMTWFEIPVGVELRTRTRPNGEDILFVINHTPEKKIMSLPCVAYDHISAQVIDHELQLAPYDVHILTNS